MVKGVWLLVLVAAAAAAAAVSVDVPVDDLTVNLGGIIVAGHSYYFYDGVKYHTGTSDFNGYTAELRVYGDVGERWYYHGGYEVGGDTTRTYVGFRFNDHLTTEAGYDFAPFGVENQTLPENLVMTRLSTVAEIAPGGTGIRADYLGKLSSLPVGVAAAVFPGRASGNSYYLDAVCARAYVDFLPGTSDLVVGGSFYAREELREYLEGAYPDYTEAYQYVYAPRVGADVGVKAGAFTFQAEYAQYYADGVWVEYTEPPIYKSAYARAYYGLVAYAFPLPWKRLQAFQPYGRYERYEPGVFERGDIAEHRAVAGFAVNFIGRNLMFRSDYTRILEDAYPTKNDRVNSYFQLYF